MAIDSMANIFYRQFAAWPETYMVIGAKGRLLAQTQSESGSGVIKGGAWYALVEKELLRSSGAQPAKV